MSSEKWLTNAQLADLDTRYHAAKPVRPVTRDEYFRLRERLRLAESVVAAAEYTVLAMGLDGRCGELESALAAARFKTDQGK